MTITAEQAQALKAGITPGRWKASDAKGTFGILCYENISNNTEISVASVWHSDDYGLLPNRKTRAGNASAIAAVPDLIDTVIADAEEKVRMAARIEALEAALTFYADTGYDGYDVTVTDYGLSTDNGHIIKDGGQIALAALNGETA